MFGVGSGELILVAIVGGSLYLATAILRRRSRLEAFFARRAEKLSSLRAETPERLRPVPLPAVFAAQVVCVCLLMWLAARGSVSVDREGHVILDGLPVASRLGLMVLPLLLTTIGVLLHMVAPWRRRLKYEIYGLGSSLATIELAATLCAAEGTPEPAALSYQLLDLPTLQPLSPRALVLTAIVPALFGLSLAIVWLVVRTNGAHSPGRFVRVAYRVTMALGKPFAFISLPTMPFYLVLRYQLVERMTLHPILYLRSFSYSSTGPVFGKVVARVARRFGVVVGLVNNSQPHGAVNAETGLLERGRFETTTDDNWQTWVKSKLTSCQAVIVDATVETPGLKWELSTCLAILGPDRLVVLVQEPSPPPTGLEGQTIRYRIDKAGLKQARRELGQRMRLAYRAATHVATSPGGQGQSVVPPG